MFKILFYEHIPLQDEYFFFWYPWEKELLTKSQHPKMNVGPWVVFEIIGSLSNRSSSPPL